MSAFIAQVTWQSPQLAPAAVALAAIVAAAVLWLYPPQMRGVPRGWRWTMPSLRAFAAAALTIAIVQPIVLRPRTTARQGAVVLLVDRSRSMSVVDRDRTPAELVALAGGLSALPPAARQEAAPGLRARLETVRGLIDQLTRARSEADYAALSGRGTAAATARVRDVTERVRAAIEEISVPPALASAALGQRVAALRQVPPTALDETALQAVRTNVDATARALAQAQAQLDESLFRDNVQVQSAAARLGELSRAELVQIALSGRTDNVASGGGLLGAMSALAPVFGFTFDEDVTPLSWPASGSGRDELNLAATGSRTDVAGALRAAMQRMGARAVQAIVLVSDGRQVGADADGLAADLASAGVPVFAVSAAAAPGRRRDISVVAVDAPLSGRIRQTIPVRAQIHGVGFRGASIVVRLDAGNVRQVKDVSLNEDGDAVAEFDVTLADAGRQSLVVSASPATGDAPEATRENNEFIRWVRVGGEPVRVTVLSGGAAAAKQNATLHDALSRAAWVALREMSEQDIESVTPRSILAQDVIVLVDVPADAIGRAQWLAMEQLVRERGGSVIVCAGQHVPEEYLDDALTARLLPFGGTQRPGWRIWPGGEPHFRVAPPTAAHAGGSNDDAEDAPPDAWRQLPPLSRYVPVPPLGANARALLVERETGAAVVTETRRGLGKIYFVGTDQTWRWRGMVKADAREQRDQFWPRLARLAAGEPFAAAKENLHLDVDEIAPEPHQPITVRARIFDVYGDPVDAPTQTLEIRGSNQATREVTLASLGDGSGRYQAVVADLDAGDYVLRVEAPEDPSAEIPPDPVELPLRVAARYEAELADVSGDDQLLRRIADASGGQFLTLEQIGSLPARLDTIRQRQSRLVEYPLWDSPYLFVFVLACLSAEWSLRKKFGLA
ncbi:MAG: hypothetical protein QOE14_2406 [Humisphaera sp.]|nr:hypothetical protein [Humisphaera sp.]